MLAAKKVQDYSVLRDFIQNRIFDNRRTPDCAELEKYSFQLFFAYDSLKRDFSEYSQIESGAYLCNAFTTKNFQFFKSTTGGYEHPIALETEMSEPVIRYMPPPAKIKGELHLIEPWQFRKLDIERQNGVQFNRRRVRLIVPYREFSPVLDCNRHGQLTSKMLPGWEGKLIESPEKVYILRAWMYVGDLSFWGDVVDAGYHFTSVSNFEPKNKKWLKRYYEFTKNEQI